MAKLVGAILNDSGDGSEKIAGAHVVAVCGPADRALVITADPNDVALGDALPGTRIVVRDPVNPVRI